MDKFLPVRRQWDVYKWPEGVKYALLALAKGPASSEVRSGEALYDSIIDMQRESGLPHAHLSRHTADGLALFFDDLLSHADAQSFFQQVLPEIAKLALSLPSLLDAQRETLGKHFASCNTETALKKTSAEEERLRPDMVLKLLRRQQPGMVALSQNLVASLLACSFLCLFPSPERGKEYLPYANFDRLFAGIYERGESNEHKLHCILHYFERVCRSMPQGVVSYERKVLPAQNLKDGNAFWSSSRVPLCPLTVLADGSIEDVGQNCLQVDFANRMLGGGALADGCVQEEIRFMINPELIAGMIFLPAMAPNESIEIVGAERYSSYEGYASSFRFTGDFLDSAPRDAWGRRQTRIIAIDALSRPGDDQFLLTYTLRELNKAYCGFLDTASLRNGIGASAQRSELSNLKSCEVLETDGQVRFTSSQANDSSMKSDVSDLVDMDNDAQDASHSGEAVDMVLDDQPYGGQEQSQKGHDNTGLDARQRTLKGRCSIGIATGNWGCGVFGGNLDLKSLLQWLAASQAERPFMLYFSFQNPDAQRLQEVADWILQEGWSVGELWSIISEYGQGKHFGVNLFDWILPRPGTDLESPQSSNDSGRGLEKMASYFVQPKNKVTGSSVPVRRNGN